MSNKQKQMANKKHRVTGTPEKGAAPSLKDRNPVAAVSLKFFALLLVLLMGLIYSDRKGYFDPDNRNNHTIRKWDAFYDFTDNHNVDILLVGNSHLYTGINPKNLSITLGANAFILAAPGTSIADTYFALKEAMERCKPSLVVLETYGITDFNPYKLKDGDLSDQFKSFSARKDVEIKLESTPELFSYDEYIYAWSNTIRNHDYLLTNMEQIRRNIDRQNEPAMQQDKLYLGRYVRFTTGIEPDVLERYREEGPPVDGKDYAYSRYARIYVKKIVDLCQDHGVKLMFLTLPMYYQHIANYEVWRDKLAGLLDQFPVPWLNLQSPYDYKKYTTIAFENSYSSNQHMTYQGSLMATYDLASFIRNDVKVTLPERYRDVAWHQLFYGQEGYFENFRPVENDPYNKVLASDLPLANINLTELQLLTNDRNSKKLLAKVDRSLLRGVDPDSCRLALVLNYIQDGREGQTVIELPYDYMHPLPGQALFMQNISPVDITGLAGGQMVCK